MSTGGAPVASVAGGSAAPASAAATNPLKAFAARNPFAANKPSTATTTAVENNPFESTPVGGASSSTSHSISISSSSPPSSTSASTAGAGGAAPKKNQYLQSITTYFDRGDNKEQNPPLDDVAAREANLKAREEKLLALERQVDERERQVRAAEGRLNNWPFPFWKFTYHSIKEDILPQHQKSMRYLYALLLFEWVCLFVNALTALVALLAGCGSVLDALFNVVFLGAGVFCSWHGWYQPMYQTSKKASMNSLRYGQFFCMFGVFHIGWVILQGVGVFYGQGLLTLLGMVGNCTAGSIFSGSTTVLWGINFLCSGVVSKMFYTRYKVGGGNLNSLKGDLTKEAAKNALRG